MFDLFKSNSYIYNKNMKKESKHISIAIDPSILKKLDEGNYNKSKLVDSLLTEYFENKNRQKANFTKK